MSAQWSVRHSLPASRPAGVAGSKTDAMGETPLITEPSPAASGASALRLPHTPDPDAVQRADTYGLLGALLTEPPSPGLLGRLAEITDDGEEEATLLGRAWRRLGRAARNISPQAASEEYHALFIGVTEGEVVPYASWYETGFLMDRPLVQLRSDLVRLGFARQEGVREPEDHAAALCEVMGMLILQAKDSAGDQNVRDFFQAHLAAWMPAFFLDLQRAPAAVLYAAVGDLGEQILELERRYLSLSSEPVRISAYPAAKRQEPSER